ncbi:L,D-transpeptidase [Alicyclobacillus tolerans]|uniref:L,D-transpeptidase n=1 Tax=Alicyclobacillus tolerans TaxID=90970 RepID=UPI001F34FF01|nr:L,D-transpeptidase [Alicyclobacillus tolerans]MCF8568105.1 L,D-transpeptidase [Alicyclobacillus tolerans]
MSWRHAWREQSALKNMAIAHSEWKASQGINLTFTEPVYSVTWLMHGHTKTLSFNKPVTSVWLHTLLPQGEKSSIEVENVETIYRQDVPKSWKLSDVLPQPLTAVTNPGPWQLNVPRNGPYSVRFSAPIENRFETIRAISFTPKIPGRWTWKNSETADFYPKQTLPSTVQETMVIGDGINGPVGASGQYLTAQINRPFMTASDEKIVVHETLPETLKLYKNGQLIFQSLCNTARPGGYTPTGTFYIRSKYQFVNMRGVNPNGIPYYDPHVPWVMGLIGNIAIHGFNRASYGFPQSNGCVELPISAAKSLYSMAQVGTPVKIIKP